MARIKQAAPSRREVSSEYVNGLQSWEKSDSSATGRKSEMKARAADAHVNDAGVFQLAIAVGGIYASLYGPARLF